ncbi:hypothetical protein AAHE18_03G250600 [Arachis hypogaea]
MNYKEGQVTTIFNNILYLLRWLLALVGGNLSSMCFLFFFSANPLFEHSKSYFIKFNPLSIFLFLISNIDSTSLTLQHLSISVVNKILLGFKPISLISFTNFLQITDLTKGH